MRDRNGFTIVELILAIVLILALAILVVPNLINLGDNSKSKVYDAKIQLVLSGAYKYGVDNIDKLSTNCTDVTIGTLISLGYVSPDDKTGYNMIDPDTGESMNNIMICVYYEKNEVRARLK